MPELPEVESTVSDLSEKITGRRILGVWSDSRGRVFQRMDFKGGIEKILVSRVIKRVRRRGKNIILDLSGDISVLIHQKISGHLLLGKYDSDKKKWANSSLSEKINSYVHFILFLEGELSLAMSDPRKFFKVEIWRRKELESSDTMKKLGPDPLEITFAGFKKLIGEKRGNIKRLLLNQEFLSGIGNIYSDEILWDARISPFSKAEDLTDKEITALFRSMKKILKEAIDLKGDSMSDYRLISGEKGGYQEKHRAYKREGLSCKRKDGGIIKKSRFGNRYLRFCPVCQRI